MTDQEMDMWQHIDECRDKLEELQQQMRDINNTMIVFMDMQAKVLKQRNERS